MSKKATTTAKPSIYQTVTDRIISSLKAGVIPWEKPWKSPRFSWRPIPAQLPHRQALPWHQCPFALVERVQLPVLAYLQAGAGVERQCPQRRARYADCLLQAASRTRQERRAKATSEDERVPFVLCHYTVFNVEQCDGLTLPEISQPAIARRSTKTNSAKAL